MKTLSRRLFLGTTMSIPLAIRTSNGKTFKVEEYTAKKHGSTFQILMEVDGKWIVGPPPKSITLVDMFSDKTQHPGEAGITVKSDAMYLKSTCGILEVTGFRLVDPTGKIISERKIHVPIGCEIDHTLTVTFDLAFGKCTSKFQMYMRDKMYEDFKARGF